MSIDEEVKADEVDLKKVAKLPQEKQQEFYKELDRIVKGDEYWFQQHFGVFWNRLYSDTNRHMLEIKEMLFRDYEKFISGGVDLENYGNSISKSPQEPVSQ